MGNSCKINIIPNTSLWMKLGRTKYTIPKALSELIDNSIDNMVDGHVKVDLFFAIDGNEIGILDNANGMDIETLTRALTIADHDDATDTIGEHGFGLESASSYLGKNLTIYTKMEDMDTYLKFKYNQEEFLRNNEWTVEYEEINLEALIEETGHSFERGTYIKIEDLNVRLYNGLVTNKQDTIEGTMLSKFQSIYKKFIEREMLELTLHVERRRGTIDHILVIPPVKQNLAFKVEFNFEIENNSKVLKVKGWAGVLDFYDENIKNKKKYTSGFDIISKNKVILQHIHLGYSYHPEKRLVLGEIELENFQTTSDKTDFIRNSDWQALDLTLNQYIIKPALHIASTSYLNNLCDRVANNEDFNLNLDFERVLNRTALNEDSTEEFDGELLPALLMNKEIEIVQNVFEESKDEIIEYMKSKKQVEVEKQRIRDAQIPLTTYTGDEGYDSEGQNGQNPLNRGTQSDNENIEDISGIRDILEEPMPVNREQQENSNAELLVGNPNPSIDYNIIFNNRETIINHKVENTQSLLPYTFRLDMANNVLYVTSNEAKFSKLYASLDAYYLSNIINASIDIAMITLSQDDALTVEMVAQTRVNIQKSFDDMHDVFRKYNNLEA